MDEPGLTQERGVVGALALEEAPGLVALPVAKDWSALPDSEFP